MGCVYEIIFPNGKRYVGMTTRSLELRKKDHIKSAKSQTGSNRKKSVHYAMMKYGIDNLVWKTIFVSNDKDALLDREIEYISELKTVGICLYNMTNGGDGLNGYSLNEEDRIKLSLSLKGRVFSEEHKKKLSETAKQRPFKKRGPHSEETKRKISQSHLGIAPNEEVRKRISETLKQKQPWKDKRHSEDSIEKMKIVQRQRIVEATNTNQKFSVEDVMKIKKLLIQQSMGTCAIAKLYGVSPSAISDIKSGRTWSWIEIEQN